MPNDHQRGRRFSSGAFDVRGDKRRPYRNAALRLQRCMSPAPFYEERPLEDLLGKLPGLGKLLEISCVTSNS